MLDQTELHFFPFALARMLGMPNRNKILESSNFSCLLLLAIFLPSFVKKVLLTKISLKV